MLLTCIKRLVFFFLNLMKQSVDTEGYIVRDPSLPNKSLLAVYHSLLSFGPTSLITITLCPLSIERIK